MWEVQIICYGYHNLHLQKKYYILQSSIVVILHIDFMI